MSTYQFDFNFGTIGDDARADEGDDQRGTSSDSDSDVESGDSSEGASWATLDRRLLQRIVSFLPGQSDRRTFCLVSKDWGFAATSDLWAYPQFSTPQQLAAFLRTVTERPHAYGSHIHGIRFTLSSHYGRHLVSPYYNDDYEASDAELSTLVEVAQGKHVLSTDPTLLRSLLHGSDLTSPPLAFKYARACSPIDSLSIYGFRLRDKYIVNDLMRWRLREIEIIGMPRKPLANLGYLLCGLRSLRSLRLESDAPLPADVWGPVALRLPALQKLRLWAPAIAASQIVRSLSSAPKLLEVLHIVGSGSDAGADLIELVVNESSCIQSLVVHGSGVTASSARTALCQAKHLSHLELMRNEPELPAVPSLVAVTTPVVVASQLNTLSLRNISVDDALVTAAAGVVTRLRSLYINRTPCLSGGAVAELLRASTRLVALGLYNSPLLSDVALEGLASGPSASRIRVLLVRQCHMQSDGVERALPALTNLKNFSITGTEVVQQVFNYAYDDSDTAAQQYEGEEDSNPAPPVLNRSFKPMYPVDHYFCTSDPKVAAASSEVAKDIAMQAAVSVPPTPRTAWNAYAAKRFVPGLLAFATDAATHGGATGTGRRRATISSDDPEVNATQDPEVGSSAADIEQPKARMRSISELSAVSALPEDLGGPAARSLDEDTPPDIGAGLATDTATLDESRELAATEATDRGLNLSSTAEPEGKTAIELDSAYIAAAAAGAAATGIAIAHVLGNETSEERDTSAPAALEATEPTAEDGAVSLSVPVAELASDIVVDDIAQPTLEPAPSPDSGPIVSADVTPEPGSVAEAVAEAIAETIADSTIDAVAVPAEATTERSVSELADGMASDAAAVEAAIGSTQSPADEATIDEAAVPFVEAVTDAVANTVEETMAETGSQTDALSESPEVAAEPVSDTKDGPSEGTDTVAVARSAELPVSEAVAQISDLASTEPNSAVSDAPVEATEKSIIEPSTVLAAGAAAAIAAIAADVEDKPASVDSTESPVDDVEVSTITKPATEPLAVEDVDNADVVAASGEAETAADGVSVDEGARELDSAPIAEVDAKPVSATAGDGIVNSIEAEPEVALAVNNPTVELITEEVSQRSLEEPTVELTTGPAIESAGVPAPEQNLVAEEATADPSTEDATESIADAQAGIVTESPAAPATEAT
ncbi:hypothetical protein H4R24_002464, partial [Coemansia sp. RSA 988]